jgi:hypothetical protein
VVFSWGRLAALAPILLDRKLPKIQRYCRNAVPWRGVRTAVALAGRSISFAGASASVYSELQRYGPGGGRWLTMYDAIEVPKYEFVPLVAPAPRWSSSGGSRASRHTPRSRDCSVQHAG